MLRNTASALVALSIVFAAGCTDEVADGQLKYAEVIEYVDGAQARSSNGAFEVTLFSEDGAAVTGANVFYVRIAMPDPNDEQGEGWGVPEATVDVSTDCDETVRGDVNQRISYQGDGTYQIDAIELGRGTCELSLDIAVGETIREDVSFFFSVE